MRIATIALTLLLGATLAARQPGTFDAARASVIDRGLQKYVDAGTVPGIVALVRQDGKVVYEKAFGWSDKEANRPMTTDAIFRIASQTKALTSTAALQLVEQGSLTLGARVGAFIPSFARTNVAVANERGIVSQVPARRAITIRDLLTHTAGISYGTEPSVAALYEAKGLGPAAGFGWYTADKNEGVCDTMERLGTRAAATESSRERLMVHAGKVRTLTVRAETSPAARDCFRRHATMRDSRGNAPRRLARRHAAPVSSRGEADVD